MAVSTDLSTEIYFSSTEVLVETKDSGIIDVSDDVVNCRVTRRMDAVSTADVSLNNNASLRSGKYNGTINIGDRVSVAFLKNGVRVPQLVGRVDDVPIKSFQQSTFDFTVADIIEDFNYIYWDPYSNEAYQKYMLDSRALADETNDNGAGSRLYTFLQDICSMDKSMIKIATFPGTEGTVKKILDMTVNDNQIDKDAEAEKMYNLFFGTSNMLDGSGSDTDAGGNGMISPNSTTSSDNQAKIVNKMLGTSANSDESASVVAFDSTQGPKTFRQTWSQHDGASIHTGLYGLSKEQMKQHAGVNSYAKDCSADKQTKAMTSIMGSMHGSISSNIWYYFNGFGLTYNSGTNINYRGHGKLYLHGKAINTKSDWEGVLNEAIKSVGIKAPVKSGGTMDKGKVPHRRTPRIQAARPRPIRAHRPNGTHSTVPTMPVFHRSMPMGSPDPNAGTCILSIARRFSGKGLRYSRLTATAGTTESSRAASLSLPTKWSNLARRTRPNAAMWRSGNGRVRAATGHTAMLP